MEDNRADNTLHTARRIVDLLAELNIPYAVIGAMALAARGYPRATIDFDIGTRR